MLSPLFALLALTGHLDPLAGRDPFVVDGAFVGGATSWGLVLLDPPTDDDDAPGFRRVCEEATGGAAWLAHRVPDGSVLVATADGLVVTADQGCSWAPVPSVLANLEVASLVVAHAAPSTVFLSTSRPGAPNGVWRSLDGGATFAETSLAGTINPLLELAVSDDGTQVFVSGADLDVERPLLRGSVDGGATFVDATFDMSALTRVRVLAVDGDRVWLTVIDASDRAKLASADLALTALRTEAAFDGDVVALVPFAGTQFALVRPGALYRRDVDTGAWAVIGGVVPSCLKKLAGDERLWACTVAPAQFAVSDDGATFTPVLGPDEIEERACPADSYATQVCAPPVPPVEDVDAGPADAGPDEPVDAGTGDAGADEAPPVDDTRPNEGARGCAGAGAPLWGTLAAVLVARRRRAGAQGPRA